MTTRTGREVTLSAHTVARIASCSFDDLLRLEAPRSSALVLAVERAAEEVAEISGRLCAHLFEAVPRAGDPSLRRLLVNMQRDVFQKRAPKAGAVERARAALDDAGVRLLDDYLRALEALASIEREAETTFSDDLARIRADFRDLLRGEVMQDALVLSSVKLLDSLNRFYLVRTDLNGKDLDAEVGATKYFSRAAAKTSPFSKFTALAPVTIGESHEPIHIGNETMALQSSVRLNARVLFMLRSFLGQDAVVRGRLPLRLNGTVGTTGGHYSFLTNWNNIEAFQQIATHPAVDFVVDELQTPRAWRDLEQAIADAFECDAGEAVALMEKLLSVGLIETDLAVSGSDPEWDLALGALLRETAADVPAAGAVAAALAETRRDTETFASARGEERVRIRNRILDTLGAAMPSAEDVSMQTAGAGDQVFEHGRLRQFSVPPQYLLFEDATVDLQMRVRAEDVDALAGPASRLIDAFAEFDVSLDEREQLEDFFVGRYRGAEVPLLTLYEDFYRHRKEIGESGEPPQRSRARAARNDERLARLKTRLRGRANGEVVQVAAADLDAAGLPDGSGDREPNSYAAVVQCYVEQREGRDVLCGVVNGFGPGFGKLTNRFLHLLPPATTEEMRGHHQRLSRDAIFAEAVDASYFNANVHPPLMPFEISIPGAQTTLPPSRQIKVRDLTVRAAGGRLGLIHAPSGRPVLAFDCGLQRVTSRSKLYQLLSLFSPCGQPTTFPLLMVVNRLAVEADAGRGRSVAVWPRVVFDERLVLQRRRWDVPPELLPVRSRGESALSWFRRVDQWRRGLGLPRRVFARIGFKDPKAAKLKYRDDNKPQFLSFGNPLLIAVFEKMLPKVETVLELSEMLPAPDQLLEIAGKRHVTEHVFQWYCGLE